MRQSRAEPSCQVSPCERGPECRRSPAAPSFAKYPQPNTPLTPPAPHTWGHNALITAVTSARGRGFTTAGLSPAPRVGQHTQSEARGGVAPPPPVRLRGLPYAFHTPASPSLQLCIAPPRPPDPRFVALGHLGTHQDATFINLIQFTRVTRRVAKVPCRARGSGGSPSCMGRRRGRPSC